MLVPTTRPIGAEALLGWLIPKWKQEGIQIHLDDLQTLVYEDGLLSIVSN